MKKAILLKSNLSVELVDFVEDSLEFYYKHIECNLIDIVRPYNLESLGYEFKKHKFILIVDDEGLLKNNFKINLHASLAYGDGLAGHVLVCKEEYTDNGIITVGLTEEDVDIFNKGMSKLVDKLIDK